MKETFCRSPTGAAIVWGRRHVNITIDNWVTFTGRSLVVTWDGFFPLLMLQQLAIIKKLTAIIIEKTLSVTAHS
jgi:hypothetical protein